MLSSSYNTRNRNRSKAFKPGKESFSYPASSQGPSNVLEPITVDKDTSSPVPYVKDKDNIDWDDVINSEDHGNLIKYSSLLTTKNAFDKAFEQFDELHAKAVLLTPRQKVTPFKFILSPDKLCSPSLTMNTLEQTPLSESPARENADCISSFKSPFITKRKKVNFNCSTPKSYSNIDDFRTPVNSMHLMDTPVSGIKPLTCVDESCEISTPVSEAKQLTFGNNSPFYSRNSFDEPVTPLKSGICVNLFSNPPSPPIHLPPDIKKDILVGIVCYVDCRVDKKEASETVKSELRSLGAQVEKNFTKKVTHVVFKEGRRWVYIKAKKEGIPIVGVLWIEACKAIRGIADIEKHPPKDMKKFERILPYQMLKKRRCPILNPNSKIRKNLAMLSEIYPSESESDEEGSPKKAQTEAKKKLRRKFPDSRTLLNLFDNCDLFKVKGSKREVPSTLKKENNYLANLDKIYNTESSSNTDMSSELRHSRRQSAPGKLLSQEYSKQENIKKYLLKGQNGISKDTSKDKDMDSLEKNVEKNLFITDELEKMKKTRNGKKKQLLDPTQCFMDITGINPIDSSGPEVEIPLTPKRPRTKATCRSKTLKLAISQKLQQRAKLKTEIADNNDDSSPSSVFFVDKSKNGCKTQQYQPSVVFTSVPKDELPKYVEMVNKLGKLTIEDKVTKYTTHVISNGPRRTLNLVNGIARGCWLVDLKWVIESNDCCKWLPEDKYDLSCHFPAAQECCKERRSLKSSRVIDIFKEAGRIYVSRKSAPRYNDLEELLRICSANLTSSEKADIRVGGKVRPGSSGKHVSEKWVLDSITRNCLLPLDDYLCKGS